MFPSTQRSLFERKKTPDRMVKPVKNVRLFCFSNGPLASGFHIWVFIFIFFLGS